VCRGEVSASVVAHWKGGKKKLVWMWSGPAQLENRHKKIASGRRLERIFNNKKGVCIEILGKRKNRGARESEERRGGEGGQPLPQLLCNVKNFPRKSGSHHGLRGKKEKTQPIISLVQKGEERQLG